jgi:hypothetical protein
VSLILDALNRARRERGEEGPAALPTTLVEAPRRGPLVPLLAAMLGLAIVVIGWLAWERWAAPGAALAEAQDPEAAGTAVGAASPPRQRVTTLDPSRREDAPPTAEPPAAAAPARPASPDPAVAALYASPSTAPANAPLENAPVEDAPLEDAAPGATASGEDAIDIEAVLARAREELGEPALAPHPAPLLADLSQQQKDAIPTLMYLRHDYLASGVSSVLINGETRRVGDRIGTVQVEEILPDSVVLRHRDTLFRLRALNSWVNL